MSRLGCTGTGHKLQWQKKGSWRSGEKGKGKGPGGKDGEGTTRVRACSEREREPASLIFQVLGGKRKQALEYLACFTRVLCHYCY